MKVLVLGAGGREHALCWRLAISESVQSVWVMPGNPGMANVPHIKIIEQDISDFNNVLGVCADYNPDLVVIGPEGPLAAGLADILSDRGISVLGPSKAAARLESSKIFSKEFMQRHAIATAPFKKYSDYQMACRDLQNWDFDKGVVIKSDELAAGKGVVVTHDREEAEKTLYDFMENHECTVKTNRILVEEKLAGKELSAFFLCDGADYRTLGYACDYKRVGDGDQGPNTGGMGCYTPQNWPSQKIRQYIEDNIVAKVLAGMAAENTPYKGILFVGLMIDGDAVNVIEFNVRFGDPETQTLLPLVTGDLGLALKRSADGKLRQTDIELGMQKNVSVHVVMASEGYPSIDKTPMNLGHEITYRALEDENEYLFFAGVKLDRERLVNSGGRVLGVTCLASTLHEARAKAYACLEQISFTGAHWRSDIAKL